MLRAGIIRRAARGTVKVLGGGTVLGVTGVAAYTATEQGQGLRRELQFWRGVAPVVWDYYWNFGSRSPYVKYQQYLQEQQYVNVDDLDNQTQQQAAEQEHKSKKRDKLQELHEKHAPAILHTLLELKGLYIKLGQVLSVTALPIPEAYREKFRTLQSDVPGWEAFEDTVKPVLERELGKPVEEVFVSIDPIPCGAASIGQAHKAVLINKDGDNEQEEEVIIKVQYPDAAWQIPADIQCVSDLLKICVFFGVVDESAANLSFNEFSRQFKAELDYDQERRNLQDIYQSSLDPDAPYQRRGVVVPRVYPELCTSKIITMSYLPGPKLEEEARRQLEALGIDTKRGLRSLVRAPANENSTNEEGASTTVVNREADTIIATSPHRGTSENNDTLKSQTARFGAKLIHIDSALGAIRLARRLQLWCTVATVKSIAILSATPLAGSLVPKSFQVWAEEHSTASQQAKRLNLTKEWIDALFDVHAHQIFNLGCFNADAHPGNILVIDEDTERPKLGLIDFGQCKRLTRQEQAQIAKLLVRVANNDSDESIADAFRELGIQTKNDSTEFLAKFAKLMFGPLHSYHFDHSWHRALRQQDAVTYFPSQLSMVYRTSMLLRGLAVSLQFNVSVGDLWKTHAQEAIDRYEAAALASDSNDEKIPLATNEKKRPRVIRRVSSPEVAKELNKLAVASK